MTPIGKPIARKVDVVIQELLDETLVYDLKKNKAYCLNQTSTFIWRECDGTRDTDEIARNVSRKLGAPVSEDIVWLALNQFKTDNLIEDGKDFVTPFDGLSRREVVKRIGFASMVALPVISSLVAPQAAWAQSSACGPIGNCTAAAGGLCVCNPIMQPGNNNNPAGCPCQTNGDCIGDCPCANPCTAGQCGPGEICQSGICFAGQVSTNVPCNGSCPTGQTCNPDGSCSGVCQGGGNFCDGPSAPICIPNNGANLNDDCCPCLNNADCQGDCINGVCGPSIG